MEYSIPIKNARMAVVRDASNGGKLEIISDIGVRLAALDLDGCAVFNGSIVFSNFPKFVMAEVKGFAATAMIIDKTGDIVVSGLTVGVNVPATADRPAKLFNIALGNADIEANNVVKIDRAEIRHG